MVNRKSSAVHWKSHALNQILLRVPTSYTAQCNKMENGIKVLNPLLNEIFCNSKPLHLYLLI